MGYIRMAEDCWCFGAQQEPAGVGGLTNRESIADSEASAIRRDDQAHRQAVFGEGDHPDADSRRLG